MAQVNPPAAAAGAAAAALNQQQVQDVLARHDRIKKSTELPTFHGLKEKDTCSARLLIDRFETAARIANWNNDPARKIEEFYLIMRSRALVWWKSLEDIPDFPKNDEGRYNDWDRVKEEFLAAYAVRYTPKSACTNFQDLVQKSGENVQDFFLRVSEAYQRLRESRPDELFAVRYAVVPIVAADLKKEGLDDMGRFFLHQLFLAGLKEDIRIKTMEAGHHTIQQSLVAARETEAILNDKAKRSLIYSMREEDEEDEEMDNFFSQYLDNKEELEPWEEQYIEKINALRMQKGKKPFRSGGKRFNKSQVICRCCNSKGHFQKECRKRLKEGKPMVDAQGKPYENRANPIKDDEEIDYEDGLSEDQGVSALRYYGISSIRSTRRQNLN